MSPVSVLLLILFLIVEAIWTEEVRSLFYGYLLPSCVLILLLHLLPGAGLRLAGDIAT